MTEQEVPVLFPGDALPDPTLGWDGPSAAAAGMIQLSQRPSLVEYIRQLWSRRSFVLQMPLGDLRQQHMNTVLGSGWHLLSPMLMSGVYYLVFGVLLGARRGIENYAVYLVAGVLVYRFTQKCIQSGARSIVKNQKLLTNLHFPAATLPLATVIAEGVAQVPALFVLAIFAVATGELPSLVWLMLFPFALMQGVFNFGLGTIAARITVHFRDTEEILQYVLRLAFYLSGVIIGIEAIPDDPSYDWARTIFTLNPIYAYIRLARGILVNGVVVTEALIIAAVWTVLIAVLGFVYFWRYEGRYGNV